MNTYSCIHGIFVEHEDQFYYLSFNDGLDKDLEAMKKRYPSLNIREAELVSLIPDITRHEVQKPLVLKEKPDQSSCPHYSVTWRITSDEQANEMEAFLRSFLMPGKNGPQTRGRARTCGLLLKNEAHLPLRRQLTHIDQRQPNLAVLANWMGLPRSEVASSIKYIRMLLGPWPLTKEQK